MLTIFYNIKIYTKTVPFAAWLLFIFACAALPAQAQIKLPNKTKLQKPAKDSTEKTNNTVINRTTPADTNHKDTTAKFVDTLNVPVSKSALTSQVKYNAKDSIIYDIAAKKVYLYGKAHIEYQDIILDAAYITIDWNTNEISAEGLPDSTGKLAGNPVFTQGDQKTEQKKLTYNFKTKRGRINELLTKQGDEGYIHGERVKTIKENGRDIIFVKDAKYTTCDLADPHYYIQTNKLKLIPKDKVITGPALIYIEKVPIPLVLPFGFFPANSRKSSGIIIPSVGSAGFRGFVLRDGGFYYGGSDYFDLALTGDIYTGGSYRIATQSNYAKRYRFNGGINLEYALLENGKPKETPDYDVSKEYHVTWNHFQNPKAHPGTTFNAAVNIASNKFLKQTSYNANDLRTQNLNSSISYSKQFRGTPFNLSTALTHDQILNTGAINFTLPNVNFSMNRINPFKSKNAIQKRWYHDIGFGFNLNAQNRLQSSDSTLREDLQTWNKFNNGGHLSAPLSTSFKVFKFFSLSPSLTYDSYFYTKRSFRNYNDDLQKVDTTNQNGFYFAQAWSASTTLSTNIYGMFQINRGRLVALRHSITPNISLNYRPDYALPKYGIYRTVQTDTQAKVFSMYSVYEASSSVAGYPGAGKQGKLNFGIINNLELKVKTRKDTTQDTKKIKILDNLRVVGGYNFLADSLKFDPFSFSAFTTLFEKLRINGDATLSPYKFRTTSTGRSYEIDSFVLSDGHSLGRIISARLTFSTDLNAEAREDAARVASYNNPYIGYYYSQPYANFNIPWNLGFSYNLVYSKPYKETDVTQTVHLNAGLNLTQKWKVTAQGDYDIRENEISFVEFNILRDLHCWEMSFQWTSFGTNQRYLFNIHIKASTLRDLKLDKRRDFYQFD